MSSGNVSECLIYVFVSVYLPSILVVILQLALAHKVAKLMIATSRNDLVFQIMCSFCSPHGARVSGVVEESPGRLEYEVALYKQTPTRLSNATNSELPVDQAVPIGTKLQLRARINAHSGEYTPIILIVLITYSIK